MLRNFAATLLLSLPLVSPSLVLADDDTSALPTDVHASELAKKNDALRQAMQLVQDARTAYSAGRYTKAVDLYHEALNLVPEAEATKKMSTFIRKSLADALIAKAIDYRKVGRSEEAIAFLEEAVELDPEGKRASLELTQTYDPVRNNPALTPQHVANVEEVNRLLTLAYGSYDLGKYDEALVNFDAVLAIDPYNTAAVRGKEQVYERKGTHADAAHDALRAAALGDVDKAFADTQHYKTSMAELEPISTSPASVLSTEEQVAADYLAGIEISNIHFDDVPMTEVIETLQGFLRREAASNPAPQGTSINIISNFGKVGTPAYEEAMKKTLRLNVTQVSFRDLLDLIAQQMEISYYFVPAGIELTYSGKDFGPLIDRSFTVPPLFFASESDNDDSFGDGFEETTSKLKVKRVNPVEQLKGMGVHFPEGANARYLPSTRTLHVRNTAYNMEMIEEALAYAPEGERLVVLNVYVMSVDRNTLKELGFEMLLNISLSPDTYLGGGVEQSASSASGMPVITGADASDAPYISNGLRSGEEVFSVNNMDKLISLGKSGDFGSSVNRKSPGVFGFRAIWTVADLTVLMRGLNQKKNVDILQNPQLIFRPGMEEQVSIACVKEMYYPESYEAPEISSSTYNMQSGVILDLLDLNTGTSSIATPAHPSEFTYYGITEDQFAGVGTLLQVHSAEVVDGGRFVNIALSSTINEFEGFVDWGSPIYSAQASGTEIESMVLTENEIFMPIFKRTYENTAVTVAPGSILVLGGLQQSQKVQFEDKIPILGDLPLVGRLFRSEGKNKVDKVLLFFAKVDVVDPSGIDVNTGEHPTGIMTSM